MLAKTTKLSGILAFSLVFSVLVSFHGLDPVFFFLLSVATAYFWDNFWDSVVEIVKWWRKQPPFKGFWYWIELSFWKRHRKEKRK